MNIDRIAREMVDVHPSADLERRIRARVRAASLGRRTTWWTWRVGVPVGAIASLALAFIVVQGPGSRVQGPGSRVQGPAPSGPGVVSSPVPQFSSSPVPKFPTSQVARVRPSQLPKILTSQLSAEEVAWMERRIPALDPVNALRMDHLRVDSIQPEPLAITPLTMTPVGTDGADIERRNDR